DTDGPVVNSAYRNEDLLLNVTRRFGNHRISLHGDFDSNEVGEPGPYGSNPKHIFTALDTVSRAKNNFSDYYVHYQGETSRFRHEVTGTMFLDNSGFRSKFGFSFNKDLRYGFEDRSVVSVTRNYAVAFGV